MTAPLEGILIVDFSQFLAGPYASLRLGDLGARVIKVEKPQGGDLCRNHYLSDTAIDGESTLFNAINRGKQSLCLDLKTPSGIAAAKRLIASADVVIQNFRPGVIERLGLDYETARKINSGIIYGSISGYGHDNPWSGLPGQDLLAQARSGIMWLNGNAGADPIPLGLPLADISAGANLAHGILAALFRHARTGKGASVETSLLESLLDLQFEFLSTFLSNDGRLPQRMKRGSAHGYLSAPYGVYPTKRGYLALAMTPIEKLAGLMDAPALPSSKKSPWALEERERVYQTLCDVFGQNTASHWETYLSDNGVWCAEVLDWNDLLSSNTAKTLTMLENAAPSASGRSPSIGSPISISGYAPEVGQRAPGLGQHSKELTKEFALSKAGSALPGFAK